MLLLLEKWTIRIILKQALTSANAAQGVKETSQTIGERNGCDWIDDRELARDSVGGSVSVMKMLHSDLLLDTLE